MSEVGDLRVGIIMGSDSDLVTAEAAKATMYHAGRAMTLMGLMHEQDWEMRVVSAHRTPKWMTEYAEAAEDRGLQVIIAGAGGSAHLPGMTASEIILPVLGVAVTDTPDVMNRALGSMIGMPEGAPLAVFQGKAGAFNAGLMATRILALHDPELRGIVKEYTATIAAEVENKDAKLKELGPDKYIELKAAELRQRQQT